MDDVGLDFFRSLSVKDSTMRDFKSFIISVSGDRLGMLISVIGVSKL